jgi:serine/threonine protein kinase
VSETAAIAEKGVALLPLRPGQVLSDRYTIERSITAGGMGAVYQALDGRLSAKCAVKEMLDKFKDEEELSAMTRRFAEEARMLAVMNHPGIPHVRDYFTEGRACYIVMDLIVGSNLDQELSQRMGLVGEPFSVQQVVDDALEVLDVLDYLHHLTPPMIHRDVKPANLIREHPSKRIKLVDFGLVRSLTENPQTQTIVGTLSYAALEQCQGRAEPRSDLYSLGATMFHLLTGQQPQFLQIPPLSEAAPLIDGELATIVQQATSSVVADRPRDAREMRRLLLEWKARNASRDSEMAPLAEASVPVSVALGALVRVPETVKLNVPAPAVSPPVDSVMQPRNPAPPPRSSAAVW